MHPKLFISYSWSSPEHVKWVIALATELRKVGVDVILDKWDLKEGHDAHAFMERMINDPDIKKVALICDKEYAEKADKRSGGVGTEAQIITPELYKKQEQSKFVAILKERAEDGTPYLPTYYKPRIYIDLSEESKYTSDFDRLVRWIYDKPLYKKPELGKEPSYLNQAGNSIYMATSARLQRAIATPNKGRKYTILSSRDEKIIEAVSYYKYMTALDIAYLLFSAKSISHVREILTKLCPDHLQRFMLPNSRIGNKDYVYVRKGTKPLSYSHLMHALTVTRVLVAIHKLEPLQSKICYELKPLFISYDIIPDGFVVLSVNDKRFPLLLEIDRGTKGQKQFKKHFSSRIDFVLSKKCEEIFGEKAVTIIYLSMSEFAEKRRKQILLWAQEVLEEHNMEDWANVFQFVSLLYNQIYETDLLKLFSIAEDRPPSN